MVPGVEKLLTVAISPAQGTGRIVFGAGGGAFFYVRNSSSNSCHFKSPVSRKIFVSGTDTDIGKTIVSSWLSLHSRWDYFKPISSGSTNLTSDTALVKHLAAVKVHKEIYSFQQPLSPHLAASRENITIDLNRITLPPSDRLLVEGAGGLLVPLTSTDLYIDLIQKLKLPVILVASSKLGTINHTLMSLEVLKSRNIEILGVIIKGVPNQDNCDAIGQFGNVRILAQVPYFEQVTRKSLQDFPLTPILKDILL